ncbi:hypothetical protein B0A53_01539 [Rhodotorula sp. CCFEE 5036]|nr:hypothetical protein B0A53_01539 [Rhodotorula sp. CCFEE 5036]
MLRESLYLLALLPLLSSPVATAQSPNHSETTANPTNASAVCTPDRCLVGANSLTAGVHVSTPVNGTTWQIALLPGTYSPATSAFRTDNTSADLSSVFSSQSVPTLSTGFSASGSIDSSSSASYTVALQPGLTTYSSALYQGSSTQISPPQTASNSTASQFPQKVESLLLTSDTVAIARFANDKSIRMVLWDSLYDAGQLPSGAGSGGLDILQVQSRACTPPCSSGGVCIADGTCAYACSKGFYGRSCSPCPTGCTTCHEGTSGTGMCLDDQASTVISPGSSTASCRCSAGWTTAANGTQCAACASGYYQTSSGECLACDPSCESCSGPNATCLTCRSGLQPDSSDGTRCVTATTASTNGTFVTCPARTFWNSATSACVECNPLCETCFAAGVDGCLSCRSPNVLMPNGGGCVAFDGGTGLCDGAGATNGTTRVANGWVYDNRKNVCDALPPKCAAGGIDSFSSSSTRAGLQCSACLPGSYLVKGACVDTCPDGMMVSTDGKSCQACDSSCATCSRSPSYCTSCASSGALILNGTCTTSVNCPVGFYMSFSSPLTAQNASSCLACHPDCETCSGPASTSCLSCPPTRPVLTSSNSCVLTCSPNEYFDSSKSKCTECDSSCATCSSASSSSCLSCPAGQKLRQGKCAAPDKTSTSPAGCVVIAEFGVCLEDLVTVAAKSAATDSMEKKKRQLPWWSILLLVLVVLALVALGLWWFRKRDQKRRRARTAKFAKELGDKEVDKKLAALPVSIAYPPIPRADTPSAGSSYASHTRQHHHLIPMSARADSFSLSPNGSSVSGSSSAQEVPLTPRFVLEDPASPISPSPANFPPHPSYQPQHHTATLAAPAAMASQSRWSLSSYGSNATKKREDPFAAPKTFTTRAGNTLVLGSKNPFRSNRTS